MTKKDSNVTYEKLEQECKKYMKEEDIALIKKAYEFAKESHMGELRLTGEDYIEHPLSVAYILSHMNADCATICAGLMHDLLEENDDALPYLKETFGEDIVSIIEGVTVINRLNFEGDTQSLIANHRKILVGLSEDVRVIFVKMADRLHNMRTLWALPEKSQKEKAKETLDILTPIAHRLGMNHIKSELEDLSLRYLKPDVYFSIVEQLNQTKQERDQYVTDMIESIHKMLDEANIPHKIKGRAKSIYSIYKKLDKGKKFSDIYDLLALRVFVDTEAECYQVLGIIHSKFKPKPKRFKDYIAMPKTNMYQSLHTTVFGVDEQLFEIQIRTYEMDMVAENGIASHWSYKEKGSSTKASLQNAMEQKLQFFRSLMELKQEGASEEEIANSVADEVLKENVYVFTPQGDVIELSKGSTPIDFAYRVHSKVGDQMVGAIVNNNIVPLDYELKDNDIVKINTSKNSPGPSKEWLNIAHTAQAKNKIRAFFHRIDKEDYLKRGEEAINKELRKRKIAFGDFFTDENEQKILKELKYDTLNEVYINVGNGKLPVGTLLNIIFNETETKEELILKRTQNNKVYVPTIKNDIVVDGIDEIKVNIASCCKPIPGDPIAGYITKGNGITVHRMSCPNIHDLHERMISVHWNEEIQKKYPTTVLVHAIEEKNVLLDIISKTSNTNVTVQGIQTLHTNDGFLYKITVILSNKEQLDKFMNDIRSISEVRDVERWMQ